MLAGAGSNGQKFSGSGIKKTVPHRALIQKHTLNGDCRKQKPNPDILGDLEILATFFFFFRSKKRTCPVKRVRMVTLDSVICLDYQLQLPHSRQKGSENIVKVWDIGNSTVML